MVSKLYELVVVGNQKAIVAFLLSGAAVYGARFGLNLDITLREFIEVVATGLVTALGVWLKRNK